MQMISQASYHRLRCSSVVITQHSFDLETFTYYVISLLCQKHQKIYNVFYDCYGSGSSRDWAAKGPFLLGVKAVIAESYERIHRSNLVGMGIIPLQFLPGQSAETLNLTGREVYNIALPESGLKPGQKIQVEVGYWKPGASDFGYINELSFFKADGTVFETILRFDTEVDITYYKNGGILNYMIRKMLS